MTFRVVAKTVLHRDEIKSTLRLFRHNSRVQFHAKTRIRYATLAYFAANEAIAARVTPLFSSADLPPAATDIESYCNKLDFNLTRLQTCSRAHVARIGPPPDNRELKWSSNGKPIVLCRPRRGGAHFDIRPRWPFSLRPYVKKRIDKLSSDPGARCNARSRTLV